MRRIASISLIALAAVSLTACASGVNPTAKLHYDTVAAVSANQAQAETARLLALTAIAQNGDERVKDRAINELARGAGVVSAVPQYQEGPNPWLTALGIVANPIATIAVGANNNKTSIALGEQQVQSQAITFGAITGIASQGIQSTQALGQAGIAKIPAITVGPLSQVAPSSVAPAAPEPAPELR